MAAWIDRAAILVRTTSGGAIRAARPDWARAAPSALEPLPVPGRRLSAPVPFRYRRAPARDPAAGSAAARASPRSARASLPRPDPGRRAARPNWDPAAAQAGRVVRSHLDHGVLRPTALRLRARG